ncbi:sigma-70 family RNA polymerase sigma factor [Candidatus Uhrbacteria bacterium]|nr:sigma-70 family RNA polymerase sigma factor [Candidatus Uhrbacteria bacterium]
MDAGREDPTESLSDEILVEKSLISQVFFAQLVCRYQQKLLRYIQKISSVPLQEAEDLLQEAFIKAYLHLNDFDPQLSFSSWMYRITRNHVISHHRKRVLRPEAHAADMDDDAWEHLASHLDPRKDADDAQLREAVGRVFDHMEERYREVLVLKFLEEKDYKEISDILQKPMGTVATFISRAKKQFQTKARDLGIDFDL